MDKSGITLDLVRSWGGNEVFNRGLALCQSGLVLACEYDAAKKTVSGRIDTESGWEMPVGFRLAERGRIVSQCPCEQNQRYGQVCHHVTALGIAMAVSEMDDAPAAPAPKAEAAEEASDPETLAPDGSRYIEVPMRPNICALVSGSRASLSIEIDAYYGDVDFPACSFQSPRVVWLEDPDDPLVRRVRSLDSEKKALRLAEKWGFRSAAGEDGMRLFITDPKGVMDFLGAGLPDLRRAGWRVDLAPSLEKLVDSMPSIVPVVHIRDAADGMGDFIVKYDFELSGGGGDGESKNVRKIPPVEIQAAINRRDGFLLRDGNPVLFDSNAVEELRTVFSDCASEQGDAPRGWFRVKAVHAPYVKSSLELLDCVDLEAIGAERWKRLAKLRSPKNGTQFKPVPLGRLENVLRPYQKQGVYWMRFLEGSGLCGLLADEMGLGKTLQTLAWISLDRVDSPDGSREPALIVCPTSLVRNWEAEAKKFTPWLKTLVVSGPDRAADFGKIAGADVVITSYALLQRDFEDAYLGRAFSLVVLDEAQHIKNRQTKNARAVKLLEAKRRLVLTGTPIENSVADAWSIFDFLMPGYLGEYEAFKATYEDPITEGGGEAALARLKRKIQPFILRRLKKTVATELPDKIVKVSYCPMNEDSQREYNEALAKTRKMAGDAIKAKGFDKSRFQILAMLMKLRQIASRAKLASFMEVLESAIAGGHRILVFSQFTTMLGALAEELEADGIRFCYLDGSTKDRLAVCEKFNRTHEIPVFLISLLAGGTGLNLTGADLVMHYDPWWNPAVEDQATDRAHRIGQKKTVYVMKMIASGSIEEKVLELQRRKQAVIAATVDTTDAAVMEKLTAEDLNALLCS